MNHYKYKGYTPLEYGKMACDTLMRKYRAEDLPPKSHFHYHQGVFLSGMERGISDQSGRSISNIYQ